MGLNERPQPVLRTPGWVKQKGQAEKLASSAFQGFVTGELGAQAYLTYQGFKFRGAFTAMLSAGNNLLTTFGAYPGYISQIQQDFDRAGEKAWLLGISYDFGQAGLPGFTGLFEYAHGIDAIDPKTRAKLPDEREYDLVFRYEVQLGPLKGLSIAAKGAVFDQDHARALGYHLRLIIDYEMRLL